MRRPGDRLRGDHAALRRARRRPGPRPRRGPGVLGAGAAPARRSAAWSSGGPCSTRRTATWPRRSRRGRPRCSAKRAGRREPGPAPRHASCGDDPGDRSLLTPADAGWAWTGLQVLALAPGRAAHGPHRGRPRCSCCRWPAAWWRRSHRRRHRTPSRRPSSSPVAARSSPGSPTSGTPVATASLTLTSDAGAEVALPSAAARAAAPGVRAGRGRAGGGARRRTGHPSGRDVRRARCLGPRREADRLRAADARRATGRATRRTSTTPRDPCQVVNEEIYYYRIAGPDQVTPSEQGFGLHRTYTGAEHDAAGLAPIDHDVEVRDGDVVLVPHGYHGPCVAAPGYPMYYLNVLAGPGRRSMAFCDDPAHGVAAVHLGRRRPRPTGADDLRRRTREELPMTVRLTTAQALVRWMLAQRSELLDGTEVPLFAGRLRRSSGTATCSASGPRCTRSGTELPTWRGQTEQGMALAAVAFARATDRRQVMAATSSIGPGALNMVTAAGLAHANRLPRAAAARRHVHRPRAGPGAAAGRALRRPHDVGQRRVPRGLALLRPDHPAGAAARHAAAGGAGAHRPGRRRPGRAGAAAGRAGARSSTSPRRCSTPRLHRVPRPRPDTRALADGGAGAALGPASAAGRRRRRALLRGRPTRWSDWRRRTAYRSWRRAAGRTADRARPPAARRPAGHHRLHLGQHAGRGGRRRGGRRHPAAGLHHGVVDAVRATTCGSSRSTPRASTPSSTALTRWSATRGRCSSELAAALAGWRVDPQWSARPRRRAGALGRARGPACARAWRRTGR